MDDEYLFVSDCHLDTNRQDITIAFIGFLQNRAKNARFLYVLGDLFDVWVGDDDSAHGHTEVFRCLKDLSRSTQIFFLAGNRDFLLGDQATAQMGVSIIREPVTLLLGKQKTGLLHGDLLCTDDTSYQQFRKIVRDPAWQHDFLMKPLVERKQIASNLREQSRNTLQHKSMAIMDVNQQTVTQYFTEIGIQVMIHGHTHQPAVHQYENNLTRFVLGDWDPKPSYLSWRQSQGFMLTDHRVDGPV